MANKGTFGACGLWNWDDHADACGNNAHVSGNIYQKVSKWLWLQIASSFLQTSESRATLESTNPLIVHIYWTSPPLCIVRGVVVVVAE